MMIGIGLSITNLSNSPAVQTVKGDDKCKDHKPKKPKKDKESD